MRLATEQAQVLADFFQGQGYETGWVDRDIGPQGRSTGPVNFDVWKGGTGVSGKAVTIVVHEPDATIEVRGRSGDKEKIEKLLAKHGLGDFLLGRMAALPARLVVGKPPPKIDVLWHGGFTAETWGPNLGTSTLWRPAHVLKETVGTLTDYETKSFYQTNDDVTEARYKVPHYNYPVVVWFDNKTGERIA